MASPIYFFTRSGCVWCQKMKPSIDEINKTLNDEQKIQICSIDEEKSKVIYDSVIRMNKLQNIVPLMYNSNIGTTLQLGCTCEPRLATNGSQTHPSTMTS